MAVSLTYLVEQTRLVSGLRGNRLFSDDQICTLLTDAYADLRDLLIVRFAYWFRSTYDFTLTGGNDGNFLELSEVPDLEMVQGLDYVDANGNHYTIEMLPSFANRNAFNGAWPGNVGPAFNGAMGRWYFLDGGRLFVLPPANSNGTYQLIYTPMGDTFAFPVTVEFEIAAADNPQVPPIGPLDGTGSWQLANANEAGATDIPTSGFDLVLEFGAGPPDNTAFSGTYNVVDLGLPPTFGVPSFGVSNLVSTAGFANPAEGTGTYTYQPVGTISELPQALAPWNKYLILFASLAIRTSRQQQTTDLELQFQQIRQRVIALTKQRSEGVRQAPITRTNYGGTWRGGGY